MATYVDTSPNPQHNMILKLNILTKVLQKGICSVQKQHKYDFVSLLKQESTKELRIATALAKLLRYQEIFRKNSLRSGFSSITHQKPKTEELAFNASYNPSYLELENSLKTERIKQLFHSGPDRYFKLDRCLEISQLYLSKTRGKQLVSAFYCLRSSIALRNSNNCSESVTLETPDFVTKTQDTSSEKIRDSKTDQQLNSVESPKEEKNQLINRSLINKSQSMNTLEDIEHENHERSRSHGGRNQWHRRRRSSEEIFEQFRKNANFPDKGATTISRDPSFTKEGGDHQMLPGGINVPDRDFSISAILDSPRLMKKSPIKESLLKMFSSKRRENFIQNLTPETQREKTPERRYATPTRNKGSELKLRLNKISRLLLSPNALSQRKIEKYLRFEHSLFQISRITLGVRRRNLLQAFELVQFYNPNALLYLDKPYLHLRNVLQVANQLWNKYKAEDFQKWKRSRTLTMQQRFAARLVDGWIRSNFRLTLQASLTAIRLYSVERCGKKAEMSERNQKNVHQLYHWIVSKHHQCNLSLMKEFFDIYRAKQSICKGVIAGIQSMNKIIIRSGFNQLNQVLKKASAVKKLVKVAAAIQKSQIEYSMSQLDSNLIHFQEQVSSHADAAKTIYRLLHQKQKESSFLAFLRLQKHASFGVGQDEEIKAYRRQQAVVHLCRVCKNTILKRMYSAFEGMKFCQTLSYRIQLHTLLKGIFLRRKALVFSELRTYCRLMSQFDEGLDYFRHRLKNQLAESESTRQVNKRAAVKLFMAAVRTAHRETKRWAFRQFPKSSTVVRIVEKQYEQKEVTPQSSEDLVNLTQVQEMQAASTIFYIACGVHKAQILGLKNSGFSEIKAHSVESIFSRAKDGGNASHEI